MGIEKENYGVTKEGKQVTKYTLTNGQGASVSFLDYGAVIQSIIVPDKDGKLEDVVLGYDTLSGYESNVPSFGSPVGRCANRISNACFVLNGKEYPLDNNDATNCLHGGFLRYNYLCMMRNVRQVRMMQVYHFQELVRMASRDSGKSDTYDHIYLNDATS